MEGRLIYSLYADEGIDEIRHYSYNFKIFKYIFSKLSGHTFLIRIHPSIQIIIKPITAFEDHLASKLANLKLIVVTGFCSRCFNYSTHDDFFWEVHEVRLHCAVPEAILRKPVGFEVT